MCETGAGAKKKAVLKDAPFCPCLSFPFGDFVRFKTQKGAGETHFNCSDRTHFLSLSLSLPDSRKNWQNIENFPQKAPDVDENSGGVSLDQQRPDHWQWMRIHFSPTKCYSCIILLRGFNSPIGNKYTSSVPFFVVPLIGAFLHTVDSIAPLQAKNITFCFCLNTCCRETVMKGSELLIMTRAFCMWRECTGILAQSNCSARELRPPRRPLTVLIAASSAAASTSPGRPHFKPHSLLPLPFLHSFAAFFFLCERSSGRSSSEVITACTHMRPRLLTRVLARTHTHTHADTGGLEKWSTLNIYVGTRWGYSSLKF